MAMRVVVPVITALVLIAVGVFWMFMMLVGANGYDGSTGMKILVGNFVLVIVTIVISSILSGWLAHVVQRRSGISSWVVGPLAVVFVTAASILALFVVGFLIVAVVDSTRRRPPPPQQTPAANRRVGVYQAGEYYADNFRGRGA